MNKEQILIKRSSLGLPHWKPSQRKRLNKLLLDTSTTIAYWCSDSNGKPTNGGKELPSVYPGLIQEIEGKLVFCKNALHATFTPHLWKGSRVWIVALSGEVIKEEDKLGARRREILGEVLPEEAFSESVGVRLGRKDLAGVNLSFANLSGADLSGAYRPENPPKGWKIVKEYLQKI